MKKLLLIVVLLFNSFAQLSAQVDNLNQLFDKYQDTEGVTSIKISKSMFGMLNKLDIKDAELDQIKPLLSKIQGLKILIIENPNENNADHPKSFYENLGKEILTSVNNLNYEELVTVKSKGNNIKFLSADASNGILDNLLLNIQSEDNTLLMMLDGKISMDDVNKLINETNQLDKDDSSISYETSTSDTSSSFASNASYNNKGEERKVGNFTGIEASAGVKVNFTQSNTQKVFVDTDPGMSPYIKTEVQNGILKIGIDSKGKNNLKIKKILVSVDAPHLQSIHTTSGANFSTINTVKEKSFDVKVESGSALNAMLEASSTINADATSGSSMRLDIDTPVLVFNANSGSSSTITGESDKVNYQLSSAASCNAQNLEADYVIANVTSGASLKLNAEESLNAITNSGGSIRFSGKPKKFAADNTSGGTTKPIN